MTAEQYAVERKLIALRLSVYVLLRFGVKVSRTPEFQRFMDRTLGAKQ